MQPDKSLFEVVPAKDQWTKNCIVIPEGARPELLDIIQAAAHNDAKVDNSDDEAGDDQYAVQFPGRDQELLDQDQINGRLRVLLSWDTEDE